MHQHQQPPRPNFFAMFVQTAARAGLAGLERAPVGKPIKDKGSNCTPCAAQARRDAAAKMVRGE